MSIRTAEILKSQDKICIRVCLSMHIEKAEEGGYVSYCPELDLYSQGETTKEAQKNIIEASSLFIEDCFERGTLRQVLVECGFSMGGEKTKHRRKPHASPATRIIEFLAEIPIFAPVFA